MAKVTKSVDTKEKAAAFVNVNVVGKNGKKQLGGIPLYASNDFHALLLKHVEAGGSITIDTDIHHVEPADAFEF